MLILRPLERADLVTLLPWRNNRYLRNATHGFRFPVNSDMQEAWFEDTIVKAPPTKAVFAIQQDDGALAGIAQLDAIDPIHRNARLGIFLGDPSLRGQGLGQRALLELIDFGFSQLNLAKIYLYVNAGNIAASALYAKNGFVAEGLLKAHYFSDGAWEDLHIMSMFQTDYAQR